MSLTINNMNNNGMNFFGVGSSNNKGFGLESLIGDYNTIKSGSYGKLMGAYFKKVDSANKTEDSKKDTSINKTTSDIKSKANSLSEATDTLLAKGSKSVFKQKEVTKEDGTKSMEYDKDAIYSAVSKYVDAYNNMLDSGQKSDSTNVLIQTASLATASTSTAKTLGQVGITVGANNHLVLDETFFKEKADMNTVKTLFNGQGSYAYQVSSKAKMIENYAANELSKKGTYNNNAVLSTADVISSFKQDI